MGNSQTPKYSAAGDNFLTRNSPQSSVVAIELNNNQTVTIDEIVTLESQFTGKSQSKRTRNWNEKEEAEISNYQQGKSNNL